MSDNPGKSGQQIGAENVVKLKSYLNSVDAIPARAGKANITGIAKACGFDRQVLYNNDEAKKLLADAIAEKGLKGLEQRETEADPERIMMEGKINRLEQANAALSSEVFELRRKLRKLAHLEMLYEKGKRAIL